MSQLCSFEHCSGCGACIAVCTHNAISMKEDEYGFRHPHIDETKCVKCGLCSRKCPAYSHLRANYPIRAYACYAEDKERTKSSSGGLATLISQEIIKDGGIVYGCAFVPPMEIAHVRCTSLEDLEHLRGSKYVQSNTVPILKQLREDLRNKKKVLFIGTPCQVGGVKSVFAKYENLLTADIICHGSPSRKILMDTLPSSIKKIDCIKMEFRDSTGYHFLMTSRNGARIVDRPLGNDIYMKGFFNGTIFRKSCFNCLYAKPERVSDVTCGDFWGLKSENAQDKKKGVSLALVNTEKGMELFKMVCSRMWHEERPIEEALAGNEQLNHPFKYSRRVSIFRRLYPKFGYNAAIWCSLPDKMLAMKIKYLFK